MVRSYNRHEPTAAFGLIASNTAVRPVLDSDGKRAYVAALEDVLVWDVKRGELLATWHEIGHISPVTAIARNPADSDVSAVGYADGTVRLWRASTGASFLTFNGHKGTVTCIAWDSNGMRLASSGQDTTIVLWDAIAEQGLFRLQGHRDSVTDILFMPQISHVDESSSSSSSTATRSAPGRLLASVSKDGLLKLWDTELQHCVETVAPGDGELWSVCAVHASDLPEAEQSASSALIFTGGSEGQIKMWECSLLQAQKSSETKPSGTPTDSTANQLLPVSVQLQGTLPHGSSKRVMQIALAPRPQQRPDSRQIAALTSDRTLQTYSFRSATDIRKKMARRLKRAKEKAQQKGGEDKNSLAQPPPEGELVWLSHIEVGEIVRPQDGRIRAFAFGDSHTPAESKSHSHPVLFVLSNNALEIRKVSTKAKGKEAESLDAGLVASFGLELPGHRADIRAIALSHNGELIASACSSGSVKVWNLAVGRCLRTMPCGYALCLTWLPDDSHILVGCKDGSIHSYEVASGNEVEAIKAHDGPVWSIALKPNGSGFVSVSADKTAKFWEFSSDADDDKMEEERESANPAPNKLSLEHVRTLKMTDDILCACFSPNGKLLALALLDSTVKVFFADSLKFFISLYGHKLPVLTLDISLDSKLIITGSADKNVKIWGLDFGDCHRSLIAHADSVMCVQFEKGQQGGGLSGGREGDSHRFWSAGKDGLLKFWDGDNFESVQTLQGHHGEIWAMDVDGRGSKVVTAGADRSIRLWEKTDELLFLEEERERQLEMVYQNAGNSRTDDEKQIGQLADADGQAKASAQPEATLVTAPAHTSLTTGERLIEAIEVADRDRHEQADPLPPPRSAALLAGLQDGDEQMPARFVFRVVEKIPSTQLTDVLLLLPFHNVTSLFEYIDTWLQKEWSLPLSSRILFFLLRTHHQQIASNKLLRGTINRLRTSLRAALLKNKTLVGFNMSGLRYAQAQAASRKQASLGVFEDDIDTSTQFPVTTKRKFNVV
ncbi:WD40 repeat-like protein [Tilletiaria anomala UBC 951]|uniref:WD40 repeat-like protein n=1 Tax=Tilletiaria anomala (strain ATCC 24038 / CBS 436.72 / UBC 951) TaxID=1037660 RepID=A0A066WEX4_TILAU|nr:WD40 repeat-like protein [Tilletiaria anomala UBC 951]KDN52502.1 WD40 repeat-like protein [Tilletiaria anomala UBC 951]